MWLLTLPQIYFLTFKHHIGINSVLLCTKHELLVTITQEQRFNDTFAMIAILLTLKSFLILLRCSTKVSLKMLAS